MGFVRYTRPHFRPQVFTTFTLYFSWFSLVYSMTRKCSRLERMRIRLFTKRTSCNSQVVISYIYIFFFRFPSSTTATEHGRYNGLLAVYLRRLEALHVLKAWIRYQNLWFYVFPRGQQKHTLQSSRFGASFEWTWKLCCDLLRSWALKTAICCGRDYQRQPQSNGRVKWGQIPVMVVRLLTDMEFSFQLFLSMIIL